MNPSRSSYVEYGTGNMLNLDAGTIKRKIDSNEYDDEIIQEVQPNGKRTCSPMNHTQQFAAFGTTLNHISAPQTPNGVVPPVNGSAWSQSNPSPFLRAAINSSSNNYFSAMNNGYQTPESAQSSVTASPFASTSMTGMDMDMESSAGSAMESPSMVQNTNAMVMLNSATPSSMAHHSSGLLPSALPGQSTNNSAGFGGNNEYVPIHGRSMEIPSYARVPLSEAKKYRDQRWSSCIYGADTRIGQGMMI